VLGQKGGEQAHTLSTPELATHTHIINATNNPASTNVPANNTLLGAVSNTYAAAANLTSLSPSEIGTVGGSQAHLNMQPFLTLNFSIALQGIFPSPN